MKKQILFSCVFLLFQFFAVGQVPGCREMKGMMMPPPYYSAENLRSDTFDILKYTIALDVGNSASQLISGSATVRFAPKINNRLFIRFDLLRLIVDSVKENNTLLNFSYNDTILKADFSGAKNITDTSLITVFYRGQPQMDGSGWGGFYFDNTQGAEYAFNLGVGFAANPHNYGRIWFPCFDNFVERSQYEFVITCDSARRSFCNGELVNEQLNGNSRTRTWVLNEEIPTYLAGMSVARYRQMNKTFNGLNGPIPVILAAHVNDTPAVNTAFVNLLNCTAGFENYFGPYRWNRIGYCFVPFNSGAMEHATNITYPRSALGSLSFEGLMSHELSHHWWGDLITCETQEDMWINEGLATFSSYLFYEWQYNKAAYLSRVKSEHDELLHFLHKTEGGFRAVSGVPHSLTYGDHVYKKGADVAHTLRGYMGDSAFFAGCKYVMQQKAYNSINSNEFRDLMQTGSGQNLSAFFSNWVFSGGWSHFAIDSVRYVAAQNTTSVIISIKQKLFGAPSLHNNVPLEISFFSGNWTKEVRRVMMSGSSSTFTLSVPFAPVYTALNFDSKISDASSHEYKVIKNTGGSSFPLAKAFLNVSNKGADSSLVRIVHNYVKPDDFKFNPLGHRLSDQHFWKVEGIFSPGFAASIRLNYDGTKNLSGSYAYLDTLLTQFNGDSMALFYRRDAGYDWQWQSRVTRFKSGAKTGWLQIDSVKAGEYTFGNLGDTSKIGLYDLAPETGSIRLFPNPANNFCILEFSKLPVSGTRAVITSAEGKRLKEQEITGSASRIELNELAAGAYVLSVERNKTVLYAHRLLIE